MGSQMQLIAVNWHVYDLLKSDIVTITVWGQAIDLNAGALGLGMLGLVRIVPVILFALVGGIVADVRDRRHVIIWTQCVAALVAAVLAMLTFTEQETVPLIYLLSAATAAAAAFELPAQQALIPNLVSQRDLTNAVSLNTLLFQIATITGPALAGLLVSGFSLGLVYAINTVSFLALIGAVLLMGYRGQAAAKNTGIGWSALLEGLRFTYNSRLIWSTMLLDFFATFFSSARTMLPIVADEILGVGVRGYGLLATAQPVGSLIAGIVLSLRRDIYRQGAVLLLSVAVYGLATVFFGLSSSFALSYLLFAVTGAGDTVSTVIRGTIRQLMTPDYLRGRMTGINMMFFMGGPQLGELEAGIVAALFGVPFAIVSGGVATVLLTGWVAWKYPQLRNYTSKTAKQPVQP
jgi:MFS family permease